MCRPAGFVNPLGHNPFAAPRDRFGNPRVAIPEAELEAGMRAYCRIWAIPLPKGKARTKPIGKPKGKAITSHVGDSYLKGQLSVLEQRTA